MAQSIKAQQALAYFFQGFSCAQSVFTAFHAEMGLSEEAALKLSSSMGGGVGGLREVCGAFTGQCMALGALRGYASPTDLEAKKAHYARVQALAARFTDAYGTLICRELLAQHEIAALAEPSARTPEYYRDRPCARYVEACAQWLEEALAQEA